MKRIMDGATDTFGPAKSDIFEKIRDKDPREEGPTFDQYDNRMWEFMNLLLEPAIKKARSNNTQSVWLKLNRPQKVFYSLLSFIGETDNGGIWQLIFNSGELGFAALESTIEVGERKLARDYQAVLGELTGTTRSLAAIHKRFSDKKLDSEERWAAFVEGYDALPSTDKVQDYFYTVTFKKAFFKKICDYIESHLSFMADIQDR